MESSAEGEGKTVAEAVESALKATGLRRDQVEVEILQEPATGFIGFGAKPARVRVSEKRWDTRSGAESRKSKSSAEPAATSSKAAAVETRGAREQAPARRSAREERTTEPTPAKAAPAPAKSGGKTRSNGANGKSSRPEEGAEPPADPKAAIKESEAFIKELLGLMGFMDLTISVSWDAEQERIKAVVSGEEAGRLIGREGRTIEAMQYLATLIVNHKLGASVIVQIDADGYWEKREQEIIDQARRGVEEVRRTGKSFRLPPMDAAMRRLIHRAFADNPEVHTGSEGEGPWRKIVLKPRKHQD